MGQISSRYFWEFFISWYHIRISLFQKNLRIKTGGIKNDPPGGQKSTPRADLFPEHFLPERVKMTGVMTPFFDDGPFGQPTADLFFRPVTFLKITSGRNVTFLQKVDLDQKRSKKWVKSLPVIFGNFSFPGTT